MNKESFNKYCAKVMGYIIHDPDFGDGSIRVKYKENSAIFFYEPYDDLNTMAEVAQVLMKKHNRNPSIFTDGRGIKQAFRDFIISTIGDS